MFGPILLNWQKAVQNFADLSREYAGSPPNRLPDSIDELVALIVNPRYTASVLGSFKPIILEVLARLVQNSTPETASATVECFSIVAPVFPAANILLEHFFVASSGFLLGDHLSEDELIRTLGAVHRILSYSPQRYAPYIAPKVIFTYASSKNGDVRGLAVLILGLYTNASEKRTEEWLTEYLGRIPPGVLYRPYKNAKLVADAATCAGLEMEYEHEYQLESQTPLTANVAGKLVAKTDLLPSPTYSLYKTETALVNLSTIADGLLAERPVLLIGEAGSGKTSYVEYLRTQLRPSEDLIRIHLSEQTDTKSLLGSHTAGERAGTFEWKEGLLTMAVTAGRWVLIEDLDKAPTDTLAVLMPLLEKRELLIPSRNQTVRAKAGFQLFATITSELSSPLHENIGHRLWYSVNILSPTFEDLVSIVSARYPQLGIFATKFVDTFFAVRDAYLKRRTQGRIVTTRDLLKWAGRSASLLSRKSTNGDTALLSTVYDDIFREAVSCLAGFLPDSRTVVVAAELIGEHLEVGSSRVGPLLSRHLPSIASESDVVDIGRAQVQRRPVSTSLDREFLARRQFFALTSHSLRLLEQISMGVAMQEPLLLVGETGTGKTTVVQYLANLTNRKLIVVNLSQQIESGDLIGGFKPLDAKLLSASLVEDFEELFEASFSKSKNQQFSDVLARAMKKSQWAVVIKLWREAFRLVKVQQASSHADAPARKKRRVNADNMNQWNEFMNRVNIYEDRVHELERTALFQFIEGLLVKAVRKGYWILLDEINLAPSETLEGIADLLVSPPTLTLLEKSGDEDALLKAHSEFRLFACMNPATDVGKKDLPPAVRSRFTELYVESPDRNADDLRFIIEKYIGRYRMNDQHIVNDVAVLYTEAKKLSDENRLADGAGQRPHFSIRTLTRTLIYSTSIAQTYGLRRALYEGFAMSFSTLLDEASVALLDPIIREKILSRLGNMNSVLASLPPKPADGFNYIQFKHYWLRQGTSPVNDDPNYIITPFVERNLLNLVRATATKSFPVLIQGPTSSGKTSMIQYLAKKSGHKFVRINNHEHTDLQEYLGTYVSDDKGSLVFQEGVLVEAIRNGHWIVLDELNLAPTDVLEALNRLLDDNRELLIPETQEVVKPHPDFMLFATQNPPGLYAGRKVLSRAFRNRFLELHFDDIPIGELEDILRDRTHIAPSYAKKIVEVYRELSKQRQSTRVFEQKNSFATLRDLFRWAKREAIGYEELAANGFMLMCERVRDPADKALVKETLERVMKVKLAIDYNEIAPADLMARASGVVWTTATKRLLVLLLNAMKQNEPVLLVGETGSGKTTIFQVLSELFATELHIVNAHQNMETGDIIGSQRPVRNKGAVQEELEVLFREVFGHSGLSLAELTKKYKSVRGTLTPATVHRIDLLLEKSDSLFQWVDGSLVQALKEGQYFLFDEISLADDSVLERLNSVLEPERMLLLPEKGSKDILVEAKTGFQFFATMNPGGDYGKKELSPALRNRFTEIWVPALDDVADLKLIVQSKLLANLTEFAGPIIDYSHWFARTYDNNTGSSGLVSVRNILKWVQFVNVVSETIPAREAVFHGACMVFIDGIGSNNLAHLAQSESILAARRAESVKVLATMLGDIDGMSLAHLYFAHPEVRVSDLTVSVGGFAIEVESNKVVTEPFSLSAPTTALNAMRVARAMLVNKPILLEGSPGVGKTSLITAIAAVSGHVLTRINLSEQTDLVDLFGSDTPKEGQAAGDFEWRDAPFLRAMQLGEWVLLDEMNLASQAVLEGLNSCLDHRSEVYIPELDRVYKCHPKFRVFAAQNPHYQGGGRKGLPKSFVNRFTTVFVDLLSATDLVAIANHVHPKVEPSVIEQIVGFIQHLHDELNTKKSFGTVGGPYEFNLRDALRWLKLCEYYERPPDSFFSLIVQGRFRTVADQEYAYELLRDIKEIDSRTHNLPFNVTPEALLSGQASLERYSASSELPDPLASHLQCNTLLLETAITCVQQAWPLILVGPASSGKTYFLRYLAFIHGAKLKEIPISGDIDSSDLLGEFDQVEVGQQIASIWEATEDFIAQKSSSLSPLTVHLHDLFARKDLDGLYAILKGDSDAAHIVSMFEEMYSYDFSLPSFRWFDGALIRSIEQGHWVVLDNANLCNPSVLDRLNSLLETNGSLVINESASKNGEPRRVHPHKNFRLFLTSNPKYGELSRAMRNRGVEVFVDELGARASPDDRVKLGLPRPAVSESILEVNSELRNLALGRNKKVLASDFLPIFYSRARLLSLYAGGPVFNDVSLDNFPHWLSASFVTPSLLELLSTYQPEGDVQFQRLVAFFVSYFSANDGGKKLLGAASSPIHFLNPLDASRLFVYKNHMQVFALQSKFQSRLDTGTENKQDTWLHRSFENVRKARPQHIDVYSFLKTVLETIDLEGTSTSQLFGFLSALLDDSTDPQADDSKLPVYRELIVSAVSSLNVSNMDTALQYLGNYGGSDAAGIHMDQLWSKFSANGFRSEENWLLYSALVERCSMFDHLVSQLSAASVEDTSDIRDTFCRALSGSRTFVHSQELLTKLDISLERLKTAIAATPRAAEKRFSGAFDALISAVELHYLAEPTPLLLQELVRLSSFSPTTKSTEQVARLYDVSPSSLYLPQLREENLNMSSRLLQAIRQNSETSAKDRASADAELSHLIKGLVKNAHVVIEDRLGTLKIIATHIRRQLESVSALNVKAESNSAGADLASAAQALLWAYMPNEIYDPAIRQHVKFALYQRNKRSTATDTTVWQAIKSHFVGDSLSDIDLALLAAKDSVQSEPIPSVYRPQGSRINQIYRDVNSVRSLLTPDHYMKLKDGELRLWNESIDVFLQRLEPYGNYQDLLYLLKTAVHGISLGINVHRNLEVKDTYSWLVDPVTLALPSEFASYALPAGQRLKSLTPRDRGILSLQILVICTVHDYQNVSQVFENYLEQLYTEWAAHKIQEREQVRQEGLLFKYEDMNTEEAAEKDFQRLFPDYDMEEIDFSNVTTEDDQDALAKLHLQMFGSMDHLSLEKALSLSVELLSRLGLSPQLSNCTANRTISAIVLTLISGNTPESFNFNFYKDSKPDENRRAVTLADEILVRIGTFLARWPEHDTLLTIKRICMEISGLSQIAPQALYLSKVEQLYRYLNDWQQFANKDVAVVDLLQGCTDLIISWRRLELSTWPSLLEQERIVSVKATSRFWFYLYENLISIPKRLGEESLDVSEISRLLVLFVSESTFGQFEARMDMLLSFYSHLTHLAAKHAHLSRVALCVRNVVGFYEQYKLQLSSLLTSTEKNLIKEVNEVIRLASWRDVNVHALKQSAQRSHRSLYKVVRKYRDFINQRVSSIVESESASTMSSMVAPAGFSPDHVLRTFNTEKHADSLNSAGELWSSRPQHLKDIERRWNLMFNYARGIGALELSSLLPLAESALTEAATLRSNTPQVHTEETKKEIATLRVEKLRLLTFVLRSLKEAGLAQSFRSDIVHSQASVTEVLSNTPFFENDSALGRSNAYFYRIMELLPRLRAAAASAKDDVPSTDLSRGIAFGEHLVYLLLRARRTGNALAKAISSITSVRNKLSTMSHLSGDQQLYTLDTTTTENMVSLLASFSRLPGYLTQFLTLVGGRAQSMPESAVLEAIRPRTDKIPELTTTEWVETVKSLQKDVSTILDTVKESSGVAKLAEPVVCGWAEFADFKILPAIWPAPTLELVNSMINELSSAILVAIQSAVKASQVEVPEVKWLTATGTLLERVTQNLHLETVVERLHSCYGLIEKLSSEYPALSVAFAGVLEPFVHGYLATVEAVLAQTSVSLFENSKAAHGLLKALYTISTEGLCAPDAPQDDQPEDTENTKDGTGLGDGAGAQSNSKNEEQDEDLTEDAQTANKDQESNDQEDGEDDAVEMEGDMAGELEDAPGQDENDNTEDKDTEDELDDEVGDIDDLDPNAVDEKMWDEKQDDTSKEKNTDENVQGTEDDVEAMEDDSRENDGDDKSNEQAPEDAGVSDDGAEDDEGEQEDGAGEDMNDSGEADDLEQSVDQTEALELPEDLNIDDGGDAKEEDQPDDMELGDENDAESENGEAEDFDEVDDQTNEAQDQPADDSTDPEGDENAADLPETETVEDPANFDDEEKLRDEKEEPDAKEEEQGSNGQADHMMDVETEGLFGAEQQDEQDDSAENSTRTEQNMGGAGEGAQQETSEQQDVADQGSTSSAPVSSSAENESTQSQRDLNESIKELGDAMKEFFRKRREIKSYEEAPEEEPTSDSANLNNDDVQHVGQEDRFDKQALGSAQPDQKQDIDDRMAVDESEPEEPEESPLLEQPDGAAGQTDDVNTGSVAEEEAIASLEENLPWMAGDKTAIVEPSESEDEQESREVAMTASGNDEPALSIQDARELWRSYDARTHDLTLVLTEQLRLILEPTLATKLRGDYRTGKRLNMKRIIPYIASQYKKDKIWLRRTKPSKRQYQIMLALDDSRSMGEPTITDLAFQAIALVSKSLSQVEAGQLAIARFGEYTTIVHPFEKPYNTEAGAQVLRHFDFAQARTDVEQLLSTSLDYFERSQSISSSEKWQLEIVISDGILENQEQVRRIVRRAHDQQVMIVFVVLDAVNKDGSILDMNQVSYKKDSDGNMALAVDRYMDSFPFEYYVLVRKISDLPAVLASVLRQYFQAVE